MIKAFFIILLCLVCRFSFGQQMENYILKNIGYIYIPAVMELQSSNKASTEVSQKEGNSASENRVVFQEKGAGGDVKNDFSSYARVIVKTTVGTAGDFEKLTTILSETPSELSKLNDQLKTEIEESFAGTGVKLINWYGAKIVSINGRTALNMSYLRQLNDQPYVAVSIYQFNNNDRLHKLTLSYIVKDAAKWEPLFSKILTSFTITNVR